MESVFSVTRKFSSNASFLDWLSDTRAISSISNSNVIAFTCYTDLGEANPKSQTVNVYVADLNAVNEAHKVVKHTEEVTCLEWDFTGTKLIVGDAVGNIQVWQNKDSVNTDWALLSTHDAFSGEKVITAVWFHNGNKIGINPDKKDISLPYSEKFANLKFGASVRQFGGKPSDGCLAISSSGLVWSLVFLSDGNTVTGTETLGQFRSILKAVDVCYAKNGHFLVVISNGSVESSINCYTVNIKVSTFATNQEHIRCTVLCQPFSSFYLNSTNNHSNDGVDSSNQVVTHLKFVLKEAAEAVVVATAGPAGSTIELWELREKPITIHKMLAKSPIAGGTGSDATSGSAATNSTPTSQPKTVVWQHHASQSYSSTVEAIATPRLSLFDATPSPSYIIVAYRNNTIKCIFRENLQQLCSVYMYQNFGSQMENKNFIQQKLQATVPYTTCITSMQFTPSGCGLVVLDSTSQIHVYRLAPITDPSASIVSLTFAQAMFEYCLITGNDWWDLLLLVKPNQIEGLVEKLKEGFNKQPTTLQQKYFTSFYQIQASLYRCMGSVGSSAMTGQCKSGDCYASIMLNAVSASLKSLLRARENQEKDGPAETLTMLLQTKGAESQFLNVDKFLLVLEHKEFFVETSILQSLQNLNQWVADLALYLLSSLPHQCHSHLRFPGCGLIFETKSVNTLRELLVIIRIWGLINENCLPVFTRLTENLDVIALLFRLLTKTFLSIGTEPDESLLDECGNLPNQVLIPQLDLTYSDRRIRLSSRPLNYFLQKSHSVKLFNARSGIVRDAPLS